MTALHARTRKIRILQESEKTLADHVEARDNAALLEFLKNANDDIRASLFQSAVLKLTCNNDAETLGAVLKYGKEKKLDVKLMEADKCKKNSLDFQWLEEEGRRNPIIIASEQASFSFYIFTHL